MEQILILVKFLFIRCSANAKHLILLAARVLKKFASLVVFCFHTKRKGLISGCSFWNLMLCANSAPPKNVYRWFKKNS